MTMTQTVAAGVETAFQQMGDLIVKGVYYLQNPSPVFDPVADAMIGAEIAIPAVRMLRTTFTKEEREASPVAVEDVKVLIPASDLGGAAPSETDHFEMAGDLYNVQTFRTVPGGSLHIVQGRRK